MLSSIPSSIYRERGKRLDDAGPERRAMRMCPIEDEPLNHRPFLRKKKYIKFTIQGVRHDENNKRQIQSNRSTTTAGFGEARVFLVFLTAVQSLGGWRRIRTSSVQPILLILLSRRFQTKSGANQRRRRSMCFMSKQERYTIVVVVQARLFFFPAV